jgi:hypothetical protein
MTPKLIGLFINILFCSQFLRAFKDEFSIESGVDCNARLFIDQAMVQFVTDNDSIELYAVNSQCYKCSDTFVARNSTCAVLFMPHTWTLKLVDTTDNSLLEDKHHKFGEHGRYVISSIDNSISVQEIKSPIESNTPLWTAMGVFVALAIAYTAFPHALKFIKSNVLQQNSNLSTDSAEHGNLLSAEESSLLRDSVGTRSSVSLGRSSQVGTPLLERNELMYPPQTPQTQAASERSFGSGSKHAQESVVSATTGAPKKSPRLQSLDTLRGVALFFMIFVNYGGGGYWFLEHADWDGLTVADLLFPWFMWMMGVSMALSFEAQRKAGVSKRDMWKKISIRSFKLFAIGMFLANGYELSTWRIPGIVVSALRVPCMQLV